MNAIAINPPDHLRQSGMGVVAAKTLATREDLRAEFAELRKEIRHTQRLILGGFIATLGALAVGFGAVIAKLYFGV